jgi:hypothetical protein
MICVELAASVGCVKTRVAQWRSVLRAFGTIGSRAPHVQMNQLKIHILLNDKPSF